MANDNFYVGFPRGEQGLLLTQRFFVLASMRSKIPTTFYLKKTACLGRNGNYSFEFCPLHASYA